MNKKEICETAYNLICGFNDIDDEEFIDTIINAIYNREEYTVEEILEEVEIED